ncbi:hypothetical protein P4631_09115 [Halalkalibacterium halodurans]|uniref:hypothetical protein n=1 Tax=Halalkalibacterium halodurans TaxID=86665 RepID=UPI002E1D4F3C|nr:hypothetical protein [Halalkalibacterium halodurans]
MILHFKIVRDYDFGEDGVYVTMYDAQGNIVLEGDWYHNQIDSKIEGFFECLKYMGVNYEYTSENINEEEDE